MAEDRKKHLAEAGAGAAVLGGTASLQRLEGNIQDRRRAKYDAKISALKAQMPKGTPLDDRKMMNGQYVGRSSTQKQQRKFQAKRIHGQIHDLNAKKNAVKRPRLAGNAKATWSGIAVGAPLLWHGARSSVEKRDLKRSDVDAGIVGTALGAGAYQESSYALKPLDRRFERKIAEDPELRAKARAYRNSSGLPKGAKAGDRAWKPYFRNYPKDLPGGKLKRVTSWSHTGKTGGALTVAAGGVGAVGAVKAKRKIEDKVNKGMDTSAFGVDHGEISKAMPKLPGSIKNPLSAGNPSVRRIAGSAQKAGNAFTSGAAGIRQGAGATSGTQGAAYRAGAGARSFGRGFQANLRPLGAGALAGGATVGGASAYNNRPQKPKGP